MTATRKKGAPRPAETYRSAKRNLARNERNRRGTDKIDAREAKRDGRTVFVPGFGTEDFRNG